MLHLANADALLSEPHLDTTAHLVLLGPGPPRQSRARVGRPVHDSIWNFRVQMLMAGLAFFGLLAMFVWFHLHATGQRVTAGVLALGALVSGLLAMAPMRAIAGYRFIFEQGYALSLVLFLAGGRWLMRRYSRADAGAARCRRVRGPGGAARESLCLALPDSGVLDPRRRPERSARPTCGRRGNCRGRIHHRLGGRTSLYALVIVAFRVQRLLGDPGPPRTPRGGERRARKHPAFGGGGLWIGIMCIVVLARRRPCAFLLRLRIAYLGAPLVGSAWLVASVETSGSNATCTSSGTSTRCSAAGTMELTFSVTEAGPPGSDAPHGTPRWF